MNRLSAQIYEEKVIEGNNLSLAKVEYSARL